MNMDEMCGKDFEKELASLKTIAENPASREPKSITLNAK